MQENIFTDLNPVQKEAVETLEGPLLILAGAGTGKTKVLTSRIVNILHQGKAKYTEILAVTFTNKAAKEMKERVEYMLGYSLDGFWIGTFHSIGLRILKRHYKEVGLQSNFTILDTSDCEKIIKQIMADLNMDTKSYSSVYINNAIARLKDKNILVDTLRAEHEQMFGMVPLSKIYKIYQNRLKEINCVDFADLILHCVDLFRQFPDILTFWQTKFRYVLVDEYQDTNVLQYIFIRLLALKYNNLCCVGDDDQSIYSWRGAEINNILKFETDFENTKVLKMVQNYRSTNAILKVASSMISKNENRWEKNLWTANETNEEKVKTFEAQNGKDEANFLVNTIFSSIKKGYSYKDIAILIRASYQSREIEEGLNFNAIPYRVIGGTRFYDRMEIKDAIGYLRLFHNPYDTMAFYRIINIPKRGIGNASLEKIRGYAAENGLSMFSASKDILGKKILSARVENSLQSFIDMFDDWKEKISHFLLKDIAKTILEESGYIDMWKTEDTRDANSRLDNIKEFYNALESYHSLGEFLDHISLVSEKEEGEYQGDKVSIITMHGSKGLEFNVVMLAGFEEGIIPNQRALDEGGDFSLQEERRLAYVAITRAKRELFISFTQNRYMYNSWQSASPSRFLSDVDDNLLEEIENHRLGFNKKNILNDEFLKANLFSLEDTEIPVNKNSFKVGQRVAHSTMGFGTITAVQGVIISVNFDDLGIKKIMDKFLKPIY